MTLTPPPPTLARDLPRGTRLVAGLGYSTVIPSFDFETYSEAGYEWDDDRQRWVQPAGASGTDRGLSLVGAAVYAQHPSTEALCLAYNLKDGRGPQHWHPGLPLPLDLFEYLATFNPSHPLDDHAAPGLIEAWNSPFEEWIWNEVCVRRYGFPALDRRQLRCAMAKARAWGLPGKLEASAEVLGVPIRKDADGQRLLDKFSKPRNPTKADPRRRIRPEEDPADAQRLYQYNLTDIDAEDEVAALVPDLEGEELEFWLADQAINKRGVHIDRAGVEACCAIVDETLARYNAELATLTGGTVQAASEVKKLRAWLEPYGVKLPSLNKDAVDDILSEDNDEVDPSAIVDALASTGLPPPARRALEIRQAVGSASVKKTYAMRLRCARDDRIHDSFSYHAARTGRPTGNGVQATNLAKGGPDVVRCGWSGRTQHAAGCGRYHGVHLTSCPWCGVMGPPERRLEWTADAVDDALEVIAWRNVTLLEHFFGDALLTVAGCLRGLFDAAPGRVLVSSDFTAIEAVVIAAMAGEEWRLQVFRDKLDIYLESISRSTGTPVAEMKAYKAATGMHHPLRQAGKIQELALGFGGWIRALRSMAQKHGITLSGADADVKRDIVAWRKASPAIEWLWGGQTRDFGRSTTYYGMEGASVLAMLNPGVRQHVTRRDGSHTGLSYLLHAGVLYLTLPSGRHIAYQSPKLTATGTWRGYRLTFMGWNTNPKKGAPGWISMDLYGGLDAENGTQAVARDIQRRAIIELERAGYPVVLHVYDEDVCEVTPDRDIDTLERIMSTMPAWAQGWPVSASGGWRNPRYGKR